MAKKAKQARRAKQAGRKTATAGRRRSGLKSGINKKKTARRTGPTGRARAGAGRARSAGTAGRRKTASRRKAAKPRTGAARPAAARKKVTGRAAKAAPAKKAASAKAAPRSAPSGPSRIPRLDRARRTLREEPELHGLPSSLDLNRHGSAARTGRAELAEARRHHAAMTPGITAGDVDANVQNAYFSGEEAPGGDNPTPDQDVVEEIGRAFGIEYQDNEELRSGEKLEERDRHRWELDPASSDDYRDRD